jgi:hypothetical protein
MEETHRKKNAAYAGADNKDALANFRMAELFGISSFMGCLVRISDKFIRIANITRRPENEQVGETVIDTLLDLANYCLIAICLYEQAHAQPVDQQKNDRSWMHGIEPEADPAYEHELALQ